MRRCIGLLCAVASLAAGARFPLGLDYLHPAPAAAAQAGGLVTMAVDASGAIYLLGSANPAQVKATTVIGTPPNPAGYVIKLTPAGDQIVYATVLGIRANALAVDSSGNAYVAGDGHVLKLNPAGTEVVYDATVGAAYLLSGLALDATGHAYVTGWSSAAPLATTPGAFQRTAPNTNSHAFIVKLSADGASFAYATYIAGSTRELANGIAVDGSGSAVIRGSTESADFPITPGAYQGGGVGQTGAPFLAKLAPDGSHLIYATFTGASGEELEAVTTDAAGSVLAAQRQLDGGTLLFRLTGDGSSLVFSKTLPALGWPLHGEAVALDAADNAYVTGLTNAANYPVKDSLAACGAAVVSIFDPDGNLAQSSYAGGAAQNSNFGVSALSFGPNSTLYLASTPLTIGAPVAVARLSPNTSARPVPLACAGNAASFSTGAITGGEIISLFGQGLGPQSGTQPTIDLKTGFPTSLANVQVTFDGIPAPLLYVQDHQINAIAPWLVGPGSTEICASYNGATSNCIVRGVNTAAPGVFTTDGTHAAALNQDGSINSPANPAQPGSIVSVFATGLGAVTPQPIDGSIVATPLPKNVVPTMAGTTGGGIIFFTVPIAPQYAGPAPFEVAGVSQINFPVVDKPMFLATGSNFYSDSVKSNSFTVYVAK